jgi:peptidoglycan/xylan/chitin deacetylase (PgdA/CDA1 family)
MSVLYASNTPECWSGLGADVPLDAWWPAAARAAALLPGGADVLSQDGWAGLMEYVLGEAQFGHQRYGLSWTKRQYYRLRRFIPRAVTTLLRRGYRRRQEADFSLEWPIEDRFVRLVHTVLSSIEVAATASAALEDPGARLDLAPPSFPGGFWPNGARFAFALTHDVETGVGQAFVPTLADLDERHGFRSSFNFVAEDYPVDRSLLADLSQRGFEIGLHGLHHDGNMFASRASFDTIVPRLNNYLREWGAVGFRAPYTHRNPEWLQALDIEYDASFFDVDPYEPMPGGTMSIWPFFCGRFVELPYTLVQDHTLLVILRERTPRVWFNKVDFLARWGGMALVNVHPDYLRDPAHFAVYEAFLGEMSRRLPDAAGGAGPGWHSLPRNIARWWRLRAAGRARCSWSHAV